MIEYPDTREMLMKGHLGMNSDQAEAALIAFSQWLEARRAHLKANDPKGLVALWAELHID